MNASRGLVRIHLSCRKCALLIKQRNWLGIDTLSGWITPVRAKSRFSAKQIADIIQYKKETKQLCDGPVENEIQRLEEKRSLRKRTVLKSDEESKNEFEDLQESSAQSVEGLKSKSVKATKTKSKSASTRTTKKQTSSVGDNNPEENKDTNQTDNVIPNQTENLQSMKQKFAIAGAKDKRKKKLLQDLGGFVDEKSKAMLLLTKAQLDGQMEDCLPEQVDRYQEFIDSMSLKNPPSVTTIIGETMSEKSKFLLERWKQEKIEELGEEGFKLLQKTTFENGKNLHQCIEMYLEGQGYDDVTLVEDNKGHWSSLKDILPEFANVYGKEEMVNHGLLGYRGKFDCIAEYKNTVCVIDWKTSKKPKPRLCDTYDNPLQLAAYAGAINQSGFLKDKGVDVIKNAVLVVCYENGDPGHAHYLDEGTLTRYWKMWLQRLQQFWMERAKSASKKVTMSNTE